MANEKSVIVKSVSLERTAEFEDFVACQKNFSRSIRVLIQQAIFQRGGKIVDIWEEYEKNVQNIVFRNQMNLVSHAAEKTERRESPSAEESTVVAHEVPVGTINNTVEHSEKLIDDAKIPEGYQ